MNEIRFLYILYNLLEDIFNHNKYSQMQDINRFSIKSIQSYINYKISKKEDISIDQFYFYIQILSYLLNLKLLFVSSRKNIYKEIDRTSIEKYSKNTFNNILHIDNSFNKYSLNDFQKILSNLKVRKENDKNNDQESFNLLKKLIHQKLNFERDIKSFELLLDQIVSKQKFFDKEIRKMSEIFVKSKNKNKIKYYLNKIIIIKNKSGNKYLIKDIINMRILIKKISKLTKYKVPLALLKSKKNLLTLYEITNHAIKKEKFYNKLYNFRYYEKTNKVNELIKLLFNPDSPLESKYLKILKHQSQLSFANEIIDNLNKNSKITEQEFIYLFPIVLINKNEINKLTSYKFDYVINLDKNELTNTIKDIFKSQDNKYLTNTYKNVVNNQLELNIQDKVSSNKNYNNFFLLIEDIIKDLHQGIDIKKDLLIDNIPYDLLCSNKKLNKSLIIQINHNKLIYDKSNKQNIEEVYSYIYRHIKLFSYQFSLYSVNLFNLINEKDKNLFNKEIKQLKNYINYFFSNESGKKAF